MYKRKVYIESVTISSLHIKGNDMDLKGKISPLYIRTIRSSNQASGLVNCINTRTQQALLLHPIL